MNTIDKKIIVVWGKKIWYISCFSDKKGICLKSSYLVLLLLVTLIN